MTIRAEARTLKVGGRAYSTPLVIPSFSSRAKPPAGVADFLTRTLDAIIGPVLVSAYDLGNKLQDSGAHIVEKLAHAELSFVLLDSGGYELWWNDQAVAAGLLKANSAPEWSEDEYHALLERWPTNVPLLAVTFDKPGQPLEEQLRKAQLMRERFPQHTVELLLKAPPGGFSVVTPADLKAIAPMMADLPVIGLTEKEIGSSMASRVQFIGSLREALSEAGAGTPIHIFGGLDPQMTPLYFAAGADVFDGLSWLRYAFWQETGVYDQSHVSLHWPTADQEEELWNVRRRNVRHLVELQIAMTKFLTSQNFSVFGAHSVLLDSGWLRCWRETQLDA